MEIEFNQNLAFLFQPAWLNVSFYSRSGIYCILNLINGKIYIGSAVYIKQRWRQHKHDLLANKHTNTKLQNSWNKHGKEAFEFIILEYVEKEKLISYEQYWINLTECCDDKLGYNINSVAENSLGIKRSIETKAKMSKSKMGRKLTEETKTKIGLSSKGRLHTKATILKMIKAQSFNDKRKLEKWPHELGIKCKCKECKEKLKIYMRNWRASKNAS